jgi:multiple sugar transport system substrate-binding protein
MTSIPCRTQQRLVTALLVPLCLLAAAACAPGQSQSGSQEGEAALRVSTWGNDSRLKLTEQAAAAFTAANPDIKVTIENNRLDRLLGQARHDDGGEQCA